jgi:hypothetical protein
MGYGLVSSAAAGTCISVTGGTVTGTAPAAGANVYSLRAHGNLDDDGVLSTFELQINADAAGDLVRSAGFFIDQETE